MTLSPAFLDELRARTLLSAIIASQVKLTRAGREYKGCCPFHDEKTPSFYVNDEKAFYHCFGCGAHGDAIRFLTEQRGLPFMDAVKELADKVGMQVPAPDPRAQEKASRAATLHDVMAAAQLWFAEQLQKDEAGEARAYVKKRGFSSLTVQRFGIGFAPDGRTRLKAALKEQGEDKLVDCGLLIRPEKPNKEAYDRFRGRLMIPIRDARGRVIGFGGRIIGTGEPKYLNSPETVLFDKGRTLYNIDRASPASRQANRIIVVEGYMDVIALDQAGIAESVAPNGTALTEAQLAILWRLDPAPILCFDGDAAGQMAAIRAALRALPHLAPERTLRFVALPAGQDPDDLIKAGGRAAIDAVLAEPEPLVDRLWRHEFDATPLSTPEERAGLKQRLLAHATAIGDRSLSQLYREEWLGRFDALTQRERPHRGGGFTPQRRGNWVKGKGFVPPEPPASPAARSIGSEGIDRATARAVLTGLSLYPDSIAEHFSALQRLSFRDRAATEARDRLLDAALSGQALDRQGIATILRSAGAASFLSEGRRGAGMSFTFTRPDSDPERATRDLGIAIETLCAQAEIAAALREATDRLGADWSEELVGEQQRLHLAKDETTKRLAELAAGD
ncbi:DNA primase [Sphingomonas sp. KRR8]|uniref:DNA primase n=1 Tax=Sphingomonas sp. KRR8 TaxID=2942996 RepID=UPI002022880D|nr:DNA primase [Sphingomonas sp. KRR8]URD61304.1 DNA primase [Sphingomonas sp. KRR8]